MAKTVVGIDIGYDNLKLALVKGSRIIKTAIEPMPENMLRNGRVLSVEAMGELIRDTMKKNGIRANDAAVVLKEENTYVRTVSLPAMTEDQLVKNLPYEFKDYIVDELKNYLFDYAVISSKDEEMELLAAATAKELIEDYRTMLRKAGLKLYVAAPSVSSYIQLVQKLPNYTPDKEICVLDLGYNAIRVYMFHGSRHIVTRVMEVGLSVLDTVIANHYNVDAHIAHTYFTSNYDNCHELPEVMNSIQNICIELLRVIHFYQFSNPESNLSDIWLFGGGACVSVINDAVSSAIDMNVYNIAEAFSNMDKTQICLAVKAAGIAME